MVKIMLLRIIKNLASMVLGPEVILWGLKLATTLSDNGIDDNCVGLIDAAYNNDLPKLKEHAENLARIYKDK